LPGPQVTLRHLLNRDVGRAAGRDAASRLAAAARPSAVAGAPAARPRRGSGGHPAALGWEVAARARSGRRRSGRGHATADGRPAGRPVGHAGRCARGRAHGGEAAAARSIEPTLHTRGPRTAPPARRRRDRIRGRALRRGGALARRLRRRRRRQRRPDRRRDDERGGEGHSGRDRRLWPGEEDRGAAQGDQCRVWQLVGGCSLAPSRAADSSLLPSDDLCPAFCRRRRSTRRRSRSGSALASASAKWPSSPRRSSRLTRSACSSTSSPTGASSFPAARFAGPGGPGERGAPSEPAALARFSVGVGGTFRCPSAPSPSTCLPTRPTRRRSWRARSGSRSPTPRRTGGHGGFADTGCTQRGRPRGRRLSLRESERRDCASIGSRRRRRLQAARRGCPCLPVRERCAHPSSFVPGHSHSHYIPPQSLYEIIRR